MIFFAADAKCRNKIGVSPRRCERVLGSYDVPNQVLTVVEFTPPTGSTEYVNSMWKIQEDPYSGDVVNSYNDGPPSPGAKQLGQFYELESSSPGLAIEANRAATHVHRTIHLQGDVKDLDEVSRSVFGVSLIEIHNALKR